MLSAKRLTTVVLAALAILEPGHAAPQPRARIARQDSGSNPSSSSGPSSGANTDSTAAGQAVLEPVIPPDVDSDALSTLLGAKNVSLAWAGSTSSTPGSKRKIRRDVDAVLSEATMTFKYPTIPLDHSNFVTGVTCSGNILTASLTERAYSFAKKNWAGSQNLVFVTSVDGCGDDNANDFFHATAIAFTDATKSFSAKGSSAGPTEVSTWMELEWGHIGSKIVKRAVDKEELFEPHPLHKRIDWTLGPLGPEWSLYAHNIFGSDRDAPWPGAWKIAEVKKGEGEADDSYKKGEVAGKNGHYKRTNETGLSLYQRDLVERELDYGMAIYCVECGTEGRAGLYGKLVTDYFSVVSLGAGFKMDLKFGIHIGIVAYVKYEKEWPKDIAHKNLAGWEIPLIISVGPFVDVKLTPSLEVSASGSLLIGGSVEWKDVDIFLDFVSPIDGSYAKNLEPKFEKKLEAAGEVKAEAKLALPIELGLELKLIKNLLGNWVFSAQAGIVEEPALVAEGKFEVSAKLENGSIKYDVNDGCYGVAWDIHFENEIFFKVRGDFLGLGDVERTYPIHKYESEPFAEGCLGYVKDGTDDDESDDPQSCGDRTGLYGNGVCSDGSGLAGVDGQNQPDSGSSGTFRAFAAPADSSASSARTSSAVLVSTSSKSSTSSTSKSSSTSSTTSSSKSTSTSSTSTSTKSTSTSSSSTTSKTSSPQAQKVAPATTSKPSSTTTTSTAKSTSTPAQAQQKSTSSSTSSKTSSTSSKPSSTSSKPTCTASTTAVAKSPAPTGIACKSVVKAASVAASNNQGAATTVNTADLCAAKCLKETKCLSFSYNDVNKSCQLYSKAVKNLGTTTKSGAPSLTFYDRNCYAYNTCK